MNITDLPVRMQSKIRDEHGCWIWNAATNKKGYGLLNVDGSGKLAHRVSYENLVGPIGAGLTIDHLCARRSCVNPRHMEQVTSEENIARGSHLPVEPYEFFEPRLSFEYIDKNLTWQCPYKRAIDHYPQLADPARWARQVAGMRRFSDLFMNTRLDMEIPA